MPRGAEGYTADGKRCHGERAPERTDKPVVSSQPRLCVLGLQMPWSSALQVIPVRSPAVKESLPWREVKSQQPPMADEALRQASERVAPSIHAIRPSAIAF